MIILQLIGGIILVICAIVILYKTIIFPKFIKLETNPKWIISHSVKYYGFNDIDFTLINENIFYIPPYIKITKEGRYEFFVPNNIPVNRVDDILTLALINKIYVKYNLLYPDKPLFWQIILCYLLDGNDILENDFKFEDKQETS